MSVKKITFKSGDRVMHKHADRVGTVERRHDARRLVVQWDGGLTTATIFRALKKIN